MMRLLRPFLAANCRRIAACLVAGVLSVALLGLGVLFLHPFRTEIRERAIESVTLPGGEVLTNESRLVVGFRGATRVDELCFQASAGAPREAMGILTDENRPAISLAQAAAHVWRHEGRLVVGWDEHLFERNRSGASWQHVASAYPDAAAHAFLRSQGATDAHRNGEQIQPWPFPHLGERHWHLVFAPPVPFVAHRLDLSQNVLVTRSRTPRPGLPEYLVYSGSSPGLPMQFDLERTRAANGMPPPGDPHVDLEVSIVVLPFSPSLSENRTRAALLARPGVREVFSERVPLSAVAWKTIADQWPARDGRRGRRFEVLFGFADPQPGVCSLFSRFSRSDTRYQKWHLVSHEAWFVAEESAHAGGQTLITWCRVTARAPE